MGQSLKFTDPTIWALRRSTQAGQENMNDQISVSGSLYEHLFGYDPIRIVANTIDNTKREELVRRGSAVNPALNIINPVTNFAVMEMASDLPPENA